MKELSEIKLPIRASVIHGFGTCVAFVVVVSAPNIIFVIRRVTAQMISASSSDVHRHHLERGPVTLFEISEAPGRWQVISGD